VLSRAFGCRAAYIVTEWIAPLADREVHRKQSIANAAPVRLADATEGLHMERRNWIRVPFGGQALIARKGKQLEVGEIRNLSVLAISVNTGADIPLYELVGLQLFLGEATSESSISARGVVVRRDLKGLVTRLTGLDFNSFLILKKTVTYIAGGQTATISDFLRGMKTLEFPAPAQRRKT
jgi:hypothetical protein